MDKTEAHGGRKSSRASAPGMTTAEDLTTPTDIKARNVRSVADALNQLAADAFVLYLKTKNFHWHVSGPHFRSYHLLFDDQADQVFASIDVLTERVRKLGAVTLHSFGEVLKLTSLSESSAQVVSPEQMVKELLADNQAVLKALREAHKVCDDAEDVASASLLENFIDETERRIWFLFETSRDAGPDGH